ncbi:MAG: helix-turn-helix transcriptional regulator [Eubacteriales bacterium]|nr:helix-turn-helix transcriptional regulator [Eubacteriales bacterium]
MQKTLGEKLRTLRQSRNYTQQQISRILFIGRAAYSNYENDKRLPSYDCIAAIADFYEVKLDYLIRSDFSGNPKRTSDAENNILNAFRLLDSSAQKELWEYLQFRLKKQQLKYT